MSQKKLILFILLSLVSIAFGATLGLLDIFGFIDGRHTLSFTLLALAALLTYISLVLVFLLNFAENSRIHLFLFIASVLFAIPFYLMSLNIFLSLIAGIAFLFFYSSAYSSSVSRSQLFVKFSPREIFYPILRSSFTYFLVVIAVIAYMQSQQLVADNSLISPGLIRIVSRPTVLVMNQQITSQIQEGLNSPVLENITPEQKQEIIQTALRRTLEQMAEPSTQELYGIPIANIPIEKADVSDTGQVDISPVIDAMLPEIASILNEQLKKYALIAPFAVAGIAFLILQPIIIPLQLVETLLTLVIFKILLAAGFIKIKKQQQEVEIPFL